MPGIIGGIIDRVRMGAESMWSSVTETRLEAASRTRKLMGKLKGAKPSAQDSLLGFGIIPKPKVLQSDKLPPDLVADADSSESVIPADEWGLIG